MGGIGFNVGAGVYPEPRPWENLLLPESSLVPRDGKFQIKIAEPMEEACYLDAARLVAYDLPRGWQMSLDERFAAGEPWPTGRPLFYRECLRPTSTTNDRDQDVTERIAEADLAATSPGMRDRRFVGRTGEHSVTLTFDRPLDRIAGQLAACDPRPGEVDGVDYVFVSTAEFERLIEDDELLEHAVVYGQYKGVGKII